MLSPLPAQRAHLFDSEEFSASSHVHRWRIEEQDGPESTGACGCGAKKAFQNAWQPDRNLFLGQVGGWAARRK